MVVKSLSANAEDTGETGVWSLGQEDNLESEMATCTPVFSPGKFQGQKSLADHDPSPWGHKDLDTTEYARTHVQSPSSWARKLLSA